MNPLLRRLASVRRRVRFLEGWRGVCAVLALIVGVAIAVGLLDWYVNLPSLPRALALMSLLAGAGVLAYRYLYLPLARPCDDLTLALRIEEQYPELNDALASTVQFLQQADDAPTADSAPMREKAVRQALDKAAGLDFLRIVDTRGISLLSVGAVLLAGVAGYFVAFHTSFAWTALRRLAEPFGPHTWTRVAMEKPPPQRVAIGQPYVLFGSVEGIVPAQAKIEIMGQTRTEKVVPITRSGDGSGSFRTALDMTQARGEFRFRIVANDGSFPPRTGEWHHVKVLPPPTLVDLGGEPSPQFTLHVPAYTGLPSPMKLTPGTRHIEALAGTKVVLRARADRPLKLAQVTFAPENPLVTRAAALAALGMTDPLGTLASLNAGSQVWGAFGAFQPEQFDDGERTTFTIAFMPWVTGSYVLTLLDDDDLIQHYVGGLRVTVDPIPTVKLQRPGSSLTVQPDAEVAFAFDVEDETFAIRSVFVEHRRKTTEGLWAEEGPQRTTLYEGASFGRALPRVLGLVGKMPAFGPLKLRPRKLRVESRWALRNQFKEGETVVLQVCADDFCDVYAVREPGRSHEVELRIVSKFELAKAVDEKLAEAQQELARTQKMQENAAKLVKDLAGKKTITQKEVDQIVEAEQLQRQVQERVGARPDEGLRGELQKLLQMLKDNKMTDGEARARAGMLKGELDRLAQQELQQALPKLAEARKALAAEEQKAGKDTPEKKDPETKGGAKGTREALEKAAELQRKAQKSLDELARAMNPWASMQQIRAEARDQREKQLALKHKLEELQTRQKDEEKVAPLNAEERKLYRDEIAKIAEAQKNLGKRADDLAKMMKDAQQKRAAQKDTEAAQRLQDAIKQLEKDPLAPRLRDVARDLQGKSTPPQKALQQQERAAKDLEKVIAALEGRGDDVTERLIKERNQAAKQMDRLQKKMRDLEKKVAEAKKIADPQERLQKMKQLAKEHEALRKELEEQAQQLARLQEQRASNQLQGAAEDIDRAAQKLGQGDPGEQERQEAKDRVKDAQKKFNENEEELAREQLAKIADRLKALKERQDAAVERSKDFHKRLMAKKFWADEYADSLTGDAEAQKGLAKDTDTLREKLKQAKVYEHLLDRAARDMEKAAEVMEERKADGLANRADPKLGQLMEKEELENENRMSGETVKYQKRAAQRLGHLLDALKQEIAKLDEKKKQREQNPEQGDQPDQQAPPMRAADGIPPMAQLKALRAEQLDVNERTADFAKRHPIADNLMPAQRRELEQIQQDQDRIYRLFQEVTAPAANKGDEP